MGNIITQATNNANSYGIDDKGNLSMNLNSTFTAQTGIFQKGVKFTDTIDAQGTATFAKGVTFNGDITTFAKGVTFNGDISTTSVNGVNITNLNSTVSKLNSTVSTLSSGAGAGSFTGTVSAGTFTGTSANFETVSATTFTGSNINAYKLKFETQLQSTRRIIVDDTTFYGGNGINFKNGITFENTGSNGLTVGAYSNALFNGGLTVSGSTGATFNSSLTVATGSNAAFNGGLTAESGVFRGLSLTGGTGTVNMTSYTLSAGTGVFGGLSLTGGTGTVNMTGYTLSAGTGVFSGLSLTGGTGTVNMTGYTLSAGTGVFGVLSAGTGVFIGLSLSGGTGTASMTGYSLFAGTGTFTGLLTASSFTGTSINASSGTFKGVLTASSFTGTSINASSGTFTGVLTANGGISLPSGASFNLIGNMTGIGQINASNCTFSGSGAFGSLTSTNMISAIGGIQIGSSVNKWQIKESTGPTGAGLLCFAKNGLATPYACIDTSGNLVAGTGYTVPI